MNENKPKHKIVYVFISSFYMQILKRKNNHNISRKERNPSAYLFSLRMEWDSVAIVSGSETELANEHAFVSA